MGVFIKNTGALKDVSKVKAHIKYVGFRSKEVEGVEVGFFSKDSESADYKEFLDRMKSNKALVHPNAVKAHKLIFSLKEVDYNAYLRSGNDYKDLIRDTLKEYEQRNGVKLDWIGSIHNIDGKGQSTHPHAHLIIKAVSDQRDSQGRSDRIFFKKEDYQQLKNIFDKEFELKAEYKEYEKLDKREFDRTFNDIGKGFEAVFKTIERDIKKENKSAEYKKGKETNKSGKNKGNKKKDKNGKDKFDRDDELDRDR